MLKITEVSKSKPGRFQFTVKGHVLLVGKVYSFINLKKDETALASVEGQRDTSSYQVYRESDP